MNSLPTLAINFLLFWLTSLNFDHPDNPGEQHHLLVRLANEVIHAHNDAVDQGSRFIPDAHFSDNQCVFHGMLETGKKYDLLKTNPG